MSRCHIIATVFVSVSKTDLQGCINKYFYIAEILQVCSSVDLCIKHRSPWLLNGKADFGKVSFLA